MNLQKLDHYAVFAVVMIFVVSAGQGVGKYLATQAKLPGLAAFFRS